VTVVPEQLEGVDAQSDALVLAVTAGEAAAQSTGAKAETWRAQIESLKRAGADAGSDT
jgi:hypothetical protein